MITDHVIPAARRFAWLCHISEPSCILGSSLGIGIGQLFECPVRVSRHLPWSSSDPPRSLAFAHLFLGSKMRRRRQDSTSPREVPRVAFQLFCRLFPPHVRHALGGLSLAGFPHFLRSRSNRSLSLRESPWLINRNPEPSNSPSISHLMRGCVLNLSTSPWDSKRKRRPSRPFSILSRPRTKIDPAALQRMEKKIDHSIHLLESLT